MAIHFDENVLYFITVMAWGKMLRDAPAVFISYLPFAYTELREGGRGKKSNVN